MIKWSLYKIITLLPTIPCMLFPLHNVYFLLIGLPFTLQMFLYLHRQFLPVQNWTKKETSALYRQLSAGNLPFSKINNSSSENKGDDTATGFRYYHELWFKLQYSGNNRTCVKYRTRRLRLEPNPRTEWEVQENKTMNFQVDVYNGYGIITL
jgi:hypothetical protein